MISDKLWEKVRNPECTLCGLSDEAKTVCLMGRGPRSGLMVVGEAPGYYEDEEGVPFVGSSGKVLNTALEMAGINRDDVYVTNAVKCRPFENSTPEGNEIKACAVYLQKEIHAVKPQYILTLGNTALKAVTGKSGIMQYRGKLFDLPNTGYVVFPTIHPAMTLRNPRMTPLFDADIVRLGEVMSGREPNLKPLRWRLVSTVDDLLECRDRLRDATRPERSYDLETEGLNPWKGNPLLFGAAHFEGDTDDVLSWTIPLAHDQSPFKNRWHKVLKLLQPYLESRDYKWIGQNGKFDNAWLRKHVGILVAQGADIMLMHHLINENMPMDLETIAQLYLGAPKWTPVGMKYAKDYPLKPFCEYLAYDVKYTLEAYPIIREKLIQESTLARIYLRLSLPASRAIEDLEANGTYIPRQKLERAAKEAKKHIRMVKNELQAYLPNEYPIINWRANQQVAKALFSPEGMNLGEPALRTKKGEPSVSEDSLISIEHPVVKKLFEYRTWELKYLRTYINGWRDKLDENDLLHPPIRLVNTVTGRLAAQDGVHQVPRDKFIRNLISAHEDEYVMEPDFSQIELRVAAFISQDRTMIRAFNSGQDLHRLTATTITGKTADQITSEERSRAKPVNFGFLYGMFPKGFVTYAKKNYNLNFSMAEATEIRSKYFSLYPGLVAWHERQKNTVHRLGYVRDPIGRVRHLPDIYSNDRGVQMDAERQAINAPVQGFASALMEMALIRLKPLLDPQEIQMFLSVHDSLLFRVKRNKWKKWARIVKDIMENPPLKQWFGLDFTVPIVVDIKLGGCWSAEDGFEWKP